VCFASALRAGTAPDGSPCKIMTPVRGDALNEKFFAAQKWEDWDKESWQELVGRSAAVLLSDGTCGRGNMVHSVACVCQICVYGIYM
jgi:hypothetical protein